MIRFRLRVGQRLKTDRQARLGKPLGTEIAGWPVALKGNVNASTEEKSVRLFYRSAKKGPEAHRRTREGRR